MYLDLYKIDGTTNLDPNPCFSNQNTFPQFQEGLGIFKSHMKQLVDDKESKTFYKFGDGDYYFLKGQSVGSASPGKRALSVPYNQINHDKFISGAQLNDYYTCEIYPENISKFNEVIQKDISYPAEYAYGLVANRWYFKEFSG